MNQPNQTLIEEPYMLIKVIGGFNLLRSVREKKETDDSKSKDSVVNVAPNNQESNKTNQEVQTNQLKKQDSVKDEDSSNSFLKDRNHQNQSHPYNISVSVHTPTTHLFETQFQKTNDGTVSFEQGESTCQKKYNQLFTKEKTQSLNDISQTNRFTLHKRWKSSQPPNQATSEKKIFLKDLSKFIMVDVMDSDCYMEKILMNTQVIPIEFFLLPINSGKKWKIWLRMNRYSDEQNLCQQQENKINNPELENDNNNTIFRTLSIHFPYMFFDNNKTQIQGKNAADDQIQKLTGIDSSNFEEYFVKIEEPQPYYLQSENLFENESQSKSTICTKGDLSNNSSKRESPEHFLSKSQIGNQSEKTENFTDHKEKLSKQEKNQILQINENLDKNHSWIQLEIITMDIGSLLKLSANIISIEEIDRANKPNIFFYNIVITRNDGLTYLVKRRYKQFRDLKNQLQKNIKKIQYVNFPSRSISKITSLFSKQSYLNYFEQAQQRIEKLQNFLSYITDLDEVYKEESFKQFFTQGDQLDSEIGSSQS